MLIRNSIIILLFTVICSFIFPQPCQRLKNGTYKVELDSAYKKTYCEFEFEIKDSLWFLKKQDTNERFKIQWLPNCGFRLIDDNFSISTEFQKKLLELGNPYYDIIETKNDTIHFIYRVNLHVQIYSGRFIKTSEEKL